jgi:speckle-type POZ protein
MAHSKPLTSPRLLVGRWWNAPFVPFILSLWHLKSDPFFHYSSHHFYCFTLLKMARTRNCNVVDSVEVGQRLVLSNEATICASFHNFADLPHEKGDYTESPVLQCHGHSWTIRIYPGRPSWTIRTYPGGGCLSDESSLFADLRCKSRPSAGLKTEFFVSVGSIIGDRCAIHTFTKESNTYGYPKFASRERVLATNSEYLKNGTLNVYMDIKVYLDPSDIVIWTPRRKTLHTDLLKILESGEGSDITFRVGDEAIQGHKTLLSAGATALAQLVEGVSNGHELSIDGVEPSTFRAFLHFLYSNTLPTGFGTDDMDVMMALVEMASRFGCVSLKLFAELQLVKAGVLVENAVEFLLFADSHCCALLREEALKFCVTNLSAVKASSGWAKLKESLALLDELIGAVIATTTSTPNPQHGPTSSTDYEGMPVWMLRSKLDLHDLDLDGTREMLIQRLQARDAVRVPSP